MQPTADVIVLRPDEGTQLPRPETGGAVVIKLAGESSQGAITIYESTRRPGDSGGPDPHRHWRFAEMFYVLEGEYLFEVNDETIRAPVGTFLFIPPGAIHSIRSVGKEVGRLLTMCVPGGIEQYFAEVAHLPSGSVNAATIGLIGRKHGIDFVRAPAEE